MKSKELKRCIGKKNKKSLPTSNSAQNAFPVSLNFGINNFVK
jgi:hypothetical protein